MNIYDESYIGLTSYNKFGYNVFGIHKSWYYLYDQPVGIKISDREHAEMQQLVFMDELPPFDAQKRTATKLTHMIDPYGYDPTTGLHILGYENGYDMFGFDKKCFNKEGYDIFGYNQRGFDRQGYNLSGYNMLGIDRKGRYIGDNL